MKEYKYSSHDYPLIKHDNGTLTYRGKEVFQFISDKPTPKHIIRSYYADEMCIIDRTIEREEWELSHKDEISKLETVDESLDLFFKEVEW